MRLPVEFKPCENCPNLQALLWGQEIICANMGHVIGGVVYCVYSKGGNDVGRILCQSDPDDADDSSPDDMVGG